MSDEKPLSEAELADIRRRYAANVWMGAPTIPKLLSTLDAVRADLTAAQAHIRELEGLIQGACCGIHRNAHAEAKACYFCALDKARDRVGALEEALRRIQQWDCLNPPRADLLSDLPWLRGVVDAALAGAASEGEATPTPEPKP